MPAPEEPRRGEHQRRARFSDNQRGEFAKSVYLRGKQLETREAVHEMEEIIAQPDGHQPQGDTRRHAEHTHNDTLNHKDEHHLAVRGAHRFQQANLPRLHHHKRDQCAGDAEGRHDHDEKHDEEHHRFFHLDGVQKI